MKSYSSTEIIKILQEEGYDITSRTFKYYASEKKVLPSAVLINNKMKYTDLHIDYLKAILTLKKKGNTLIEIKSQLDSLSDDEIKLLSTVYKPFNSQSMITDTKNLYNSISNSIDSNSEHSISTSSSMYNTMSYMNNFNTIHSNSNNFSVGSSPMMHNSIVSSDFAATTNEMLMENEISVEKAINTKKKRTILNSDIIVETKNLSNECLNEMLDAIEEIYNKYKGEK